MPTPCCLYTLQWQITWSLAFPLLVPELVFVDAHEIVWQTIAWHALTAVDCRICCTSASSSLGFLHENVKDTSRYKASMIHDNHPVRNDAAAVLGASADLYNDFAWKKSVGYGEITPSTVFSIFHWLSQNQLQQNGLHLPKRPCVVDLGSGNGKVLLAASLCLALDKAIGLEIIPRLHEQAFQNARKWHCVNESVSSKELWQFHCADFTVETDWTQQADFVFIHATVFEDDLMKSLNILCESCRAGTIFCIVSKSLSENDGIRTVAEVQLDMDWGMATVRLQVKVE